jgi:hypothetical protein
MTAATASQQSVDSPTASPARRPTLATLFTLTFALGGWRSGISRLSDNSFFWHLQTGRQILEHWVPRHDPYSFTAAGTPWVAQSWLAEAIYGLLDRAVGPFGIRLLGGLTGALVSALAYRLTLKVSGDRLRAMGLTLAAVGASFTLWSERPLFLGILALVGLLWIVEVPESILGRRPVVSIPVLMWLWANVHGTFALGFVYLGLHLAGRWLDGSRPWQGREATLVRAGAIAVVACLLNPYGPALLLFPLELLSRGDILRHVTEWRSPDFRSLQGLTLAVWLAVFLACVALGRNRPSRRDMVVSVPFLLLALWAQRNIALSPLIGLPVAARAVAAAGARPEPAGRINRALAVLLLALGLMWTVEAVTTPDFALDGYPVKAMEYVADHGLLGSRLMTTDRYGGYLILKWWPRQHVFIDDRYDTYPTAITYDFIRFSDADRRWSEILDRYRIDVVVWERNKPVSLLLDADPRWERVHDDKVAAVYVRRGRSTG